MIGKVSKRLLDILLAVVGILILSPLMLSVGLLLFLFDGRPVLFRQIRIGKMGRPFTLLKFRSMKALSSGAQITVGRDSRITPMGTMLRKTKMDELPQLFNVLAGQMSFVGPRPEVPKYVSMYSDEQRKVLELLPGITDPASLVFFNESEMLAEKEDPEGYYIHNLMPEKIRLNLEYAKRANLFTDLLTILVTLLRVIGVKVSYMSELQPRMND